MDTHTPEASLPSGAQARPKPGRRKTAWRFAIVGAAILVVGGALYGFNEFRKQAIANFFASNVPPPIAVTAIEAKGEPLPRFLEGIGSLEAVQQVTIAPQVSGRVVKIMFESNAEVRAGDPLVQLDDGSERGDLLSYQAQARLAEANLARTRPLAQRDFATKATMDQYQSQLDQAKAGIAKTQALIEYKRLVAPFDGVLGVRQIDLGQYVQAGASVVTLTNLDMLYANFTLPEQSRGDVAVGQKVEIRVDAFPERVFEAKVTAIEPQVDPQTRTLKVQATMDNPGRVLLPGMYANARVVLPALGNVVTVPETAVDYTAYGDSVYVIKQVDDAATGKPAMKAVQTFVKTGQRYQGKVAILSGLEAGERVAEAGQVKLYNGATVTVSNQDALAIPNKPGVY